MQLLTHCGFYNSVYTRPLIRIWISYNAGLAIPDCNPDEMSGVNRAYVYTYVLYCLLLLFQMYFIFLGSCETAKVMLVVLNAALTVLLACISKAPLCVWN